VDDEQRFRALFAETYPALRRYAHHRGLSPADADDLVSAVLTVAWRRLSVVPADDPLPWLFATARNVWRNEQRGERRRALLRARVAATAPASTPPHEPAAKDIEGIHRVLASLSDDDQEILRLVAWDGLTAMQLSVALGCTDTAARVRLHRARTRFAAALEQLDQQETTDDADAIR
jgi:RNA polymerase sigma-70 factor (ECF subfamily)